MGAKTGDKSRSRGVDLVPGRTAREAAIRGWGSAELAKAAGVSQTTARKAMNDMRVDVTTALALALAFERTRGDIIDAAARFLGGDDPEAA